MGQLDDAEQQINNEKCVEEAHELAAAARDAAKAEAAELAEAECILALLWFILAPVLLSLSIFLFVLLRDQVGTSAVGILFYSAAFFLLCGYCASSCILIRCCCAAQTDAKRALSIFNLALSLIQLALLATLPFFSYTKVDAAGSSLAGCALALALCHALGAASFIAHLNLKRLLRYRLSRPAGGSPGEGAWLLQSR
jgi:hypothetical protein